MFQQSLANAAVENALGAVWQRNLVIMNNLANEDTPGYKAKRLEFESALQSEVSRLKNTKGEQRQQGIENLSQLSPTVYDDDTTIGRADGNNVDSNTEQIELARAQLQYEALSQMVTGYYSLLKYAIGGR